MVEFDRWLPNCLAGAEVVKVTGGDWHKPLYFKFNKPAICVNGRVKYLDWPNLGVIAATQLASAIRQHFGHFYSDIEINETADYLEVQVTLGRLYHIEELKDAEYL